MASDEVPIQPVQDSHEDVAMSPETEIPETKSGVRINPQARDGSNRFEKEDMVHLAQIIGGVRTKAVLKVKKSRLHSTKAFYEYQLVDDNGKPYKSGEWIREKDLRIEKKRG